ncbi:SARP family transcriptional regulator [Microtetraspora sp. NBRC 13810]|uniref:BTAD domain-containing putative transcriptional regulator n=1 Tax=Microtetraspora sp. NBRC 13810 TaxID=3030990 RepID=UPI0024A1B4E2|nr:BTAD domain-containing putative transcriptional regulator [Microtetraspora sp. NBRC 13810]GLW05779.1 SARP family transcriptional regulator [Microtetraspora sp. NBRC 13810]
MRFGVLGPFVVTTDTGEPVAIPGLKVRALLAALLAREGRPVSSEQLVGDLWDEEQRPVNPAAALQVKVSQLRRALEEAEPGGRDLVMSRPPGYLLRAGAGAVDADRFAALTKRARAEADPRERAALLTAALELWRGPAFADFGDDSFARRVAGRLEEDRLAAVEERAEALLESGESGSLVGELAELVAQHPLRERLRAAHMRALYREGRQGEALESYSDLRHRMTGELGLDPSPRLAALQQAMLRQDPALGTALPRAGEDGRRTNLPVQLTELVGRDDALAELTALLRAGRLVTLTGPGGVGKTRLAVELGMRLAESLPDGVRLVELAAVGGPGIAEPVDSVAGVVLAVLGIREEATQGMPAGESMSLVDRLAQALGARRMLLILDNCEHVVGPVAELAGALLRTAPGLRLLVTSQDPLALPGEHLYPVPPLEPSSAVRLFAARAAAAAPGFTLGPDNEAEVAELCHRLDGIPLALELAATRVRTLGVRGLVARLSDRFRLLSTGHRGGPPRQQTLRAMIDWSWDLLTESERTVLRRLAVHCEGCTLDAAEEVCAGAGVRAEEVLDLLARLVDRSLVIPVDTGSGIRYRLLGSVAEYLLERLHDAGEEERVRERHSRHYTDLAERARPHLHGPGQREWLERLDLEAANMRQALAEALRRRAGERALRLVNALSWYWFLRGQLGEARRSLEKALGGAGDAEATPRADAMAWRVGIELLTGSGTGRAVRALEVLELYREADDPGGRARACWFLGFALSSSGDVAAGEELASRALAGFHELGDRWGVAAALSLQANHALVRGELAAVERDGRRSAELFHELGDLWGQSQASFALSALAEVVGDYARAARLHREGLRMAEELGLWTQVAERMVGLGRIALLNRDHTQARELHERAFRLAVEHSYKSGEIYAAIGLGLVARREGDFDLAEKHLRGVLDWNRRMNIEAGAVTALILSELGFAAEQRGEAGTARSLHLEGLAVARSMQDPRGVALALEGLAGAEALAGRPGEAVRLLGAAAALRESSGAPLPDAERSDVDRIAATAREALDEAAFAAEFGSGSGSSLEDLGL